MLTKGVLNAEIEIMQPDDDKEILENILKPTNIKERLSKINFN